MRGARSILILTVLPALSTSASRAAPATTPASAPASQLASEAESPGRFSLSVAATSVRHLDDSYQGLEDDDQHAALAAEVSYQLGDAGQDHGLAVGLGVLTDESGDPDASAQVRAELRAVSYYALARLTFRRQRTVQPFLSLAAGFTRAELTVNRWPGTTLRGRDHGAFGRASGGLLLAPSWLRYRNLRRQPVFGVHVWAEAGALLGTRLTFDVQPDSVADGSGAAPIRVDSVRAGDVMPTALFGAMGVGVSF